ncbi:MAG: hypothetical protein HY900_19460, partial [Deltaproteobacteria bacterium]|nr:hypothetical protein [Deltaproteobacteria bacterium]
RCWTLAWSALAEVTPEDDYAGMVGSGISGGDTEGLFDPRLISGGEVKARTRAHAERVVRQLQQKVFPILGAKPP